MLLKGEYLKLKPISKTKQMELLCSLKDSLQDVQNKTLLKKKYNLYKGQKINSIKKSFFEN